MASETIHAFNNYKGKIKSLDMRGLNLKPARVYQAVTQQLNTNTGSVVQIPPPWYRTIGAITPAEIMTRIQPIQHRDIYRSKRVRKPSKMFKPSSIEYPEDRLRRNFYSDHPWELARPRIVLEDDGKDGQRCDWSRIQQPGRPLNGESVVQRQLWLMEVAGLSKEEAYDKARKEFYALRHEEEVERRVTREEAQWVGAYFGKNLLEIGMELEDKSYEAWKAWATTEMTATATRNAGVWNGSDQEEAANVMEADTIDGETDGRAPLL